MLASTTPQCCVNCGPVDDRVHTFRFFPCLPDILVPTRPAWDRVEVSPAQCLGASRSMSHGKGIPPCGLRKNMVSLSLSLPAGPSSLEEPQKKCFSGLNQEGGRKEKNGEVDVWRRRDKRTQEKHQNLPRDCPRKVGLSVVGVQ